MPYLRRKEGVHQGVVQALRRIGAYLGANFGLCSSAACLLKSLEILLLGRVAEWFKAPVLKTGNGRNSARGFESHPFRQKMSQIVLACLRPIEKPAFFRQSCLPWCTPVRYCLGGDGVGSEDRSA